MWQTGHRNVIGGDVVWLPDQNSLRGQYTLATVVHVSSDKKGSARDVHVRTFPSSPVRHSQEGRKAATKIQATVLHRAGLLSYYRSRSSKLSSHKAARYKMLRSSRWCCVKT